MRGVFEIKGLDEYIELLTQADKDVDQVVADVLDGAAPLAEGRMHDELKKTSETWTGETASTIKVSEAQREGNYTFIELQAGGPEAPQAFYKEFGRARQAAEPFLRPALTKLRHHELRGMLKAVLEAFGLVK